MKSRRRRRWWRRAILWLNEQRSEILCGVFWFFSKFYAYKIKCVHINVYLWFCSFRWCCLPTLIGIHCKYLKAKPPSCLDVVLIFDFCCCCCGGRFIWDNFMPPHIFVADILYRPPHTCHSKPELSHFTSFRLVFIAFFNAQNWYSRN